MSALAIHEIYPSGWDALLGDFTDATIFHRNGWLDILARDGATSVLRLVAERDGRAVAVWPVLAARKGPLRVLGSPFPGSSTTYLGPLFRDDADVAEALSAFLADERLRRGSYFACRVFDRRRPIDLTPFGFTAKSRFETYWLDLRRSEAELWNALESECRGRIRRAGKLGLEVRREVDAGFVDDFWRMSLETFERSAGRRPTYDGEFAAELWRRFHPDRLLVLSAFLEGDRLATLVLPFDAHTLYYWGGASWQAHRRLPSNNLLHWHAILEGRRLGLEGYDLVSTAGSAGVFKKRFGPRAVATATHWERTSSPLIQFLKQQYERYRRRRLGMAA